MPFQRNPETGRKATAWLAVAFTLMAGTLVCSFIILSFAEDPRQAFLVLGAILVGIVLMLWGMTGTRDRDEQRSWLEFWRSTHEPPDPADLYQPRRRRRKGAPLGSNQPPTLESVREISESHARWVPHGQHPRRERPDR
jgi:hypothetical protein